MVIEGEVLAELAQGHRLVELADGQFGWAMADRVQDEAVPNGPAPEEPGPGAPVGPRPWSRWNKPA
jgi:hypothetical protein